MIYHVKGDLLKSDCNVIIHQSNCKMGFGSGIAGQIRKQFPLAYEAFKNDKRTPEKKIGSYSFTYENGKHVINMYGQFDFGCDPTVVYTNYNAFEHALNLIFNALSKRENKIGMPYLIGCGLANGDWTTVYEIIERVSDKYKLDIWLYEYNP